MKLLILFFALLAGCDGNMSKDSSDVSNGGGSGTVDLITLKDGTKCAVLIGYYKGALSCDWANNE